MIVIIVGAAIIGLATLWLIHFWVSWDEMDGINEYLKWLQEHQIRAYYIARSLMKKPEPKNWEFDDYASGYNHALLEYEKFLPSERELVSIILQSKVDALAKYGVEANTNDLAKAISNRIQGKRNIRCTIGETRVNPEAKIGITRLHHIGGK